MESGSLATLQKNVERLQAAREAQKQLVNFQKTLATLVQTTQTFINTPEAGPFDFIQDTSPGSSANEDPAGQSSEKILEAQLIQCRDTYRASITRLIQVLRTLDQLPPTSRNTSDEETAALRRTRDELTEGIAL
ncbi:hypothetical protein IWQ61_008288 [Dispira simplex]|nr:hypothetical protein IWQ61_008288 [Dispira simplex]